jgi:hypothetical protein
MGIRLHYRHLNCAPGVIVAATPPRAASGWAFACITGTSTAHQA